MEPISAVTSAQKRHLKQGEKPSTLKSGGIGENQRRWESVSKRIHKFEWKKKKGDIQGGQHFKS